MEKTAENRVIPEWMRRIGYYYPFTLAGTMLFTAALVLLGSSRASGNTYASVLSFLALTALTMLSLLGRLWASRYGSHTFQWDTGRPLVAGTGGTEQHVWLDGVRPLSFYRAHFQLRGTMTVGRNARMRVALDKTLSGDNALTITLSFPLSGTVRARGYMKLRDVFGLTRTRFGSEERRELIVRPSPFNDARLIRIDAMGGLEESQRQKRSDEERYYMREYIPGDRFRDINWKSSSRLAQLITRISPHTQEKTRLIFIEFRHFRAPGRETVDSIMHLNQAKSLLLHFMGRVKQEHPEYQFIVKSGRGTCRLATDEDIERFGLELSGIFYETEPPIAIDPTLNEVFIFTTVYDENLQGILAQYRQVRVRVFTTAAALEGDDVTRTVRLFPSPASIHMPGPWVLFRDWNLRGAVHGRAWGMIVHEYPMRIRLF
jgi:hypothetical protein